MSPHWPAYVAYIGGMVLVCCLVCAVSWWRCERSRRARIRAIINSRPKPHVNTTADLRVFGDAVRREVEREQFCRMLHPSAGNGLVELDEQTGRQP